MTHKNYNRRYYRRHKQDGLCPRCHCPVFDTLTYCERCRARETEARASRKRKPIIFPTQEQMTALVLAWQQNDRWAGAMLLEAVGPFTASVTPHLFKNSVYGYDDALQETRIGCLRCLLSWSPNGGGSPLTYLESCHLRSFPLHESAMMTHPVAIPVNLSDFMWSLKAQVIRGQTPTNASLDALVELNRANGTAWDVSRRTMLAAYRAFQRPLFLDSTHELENWRVSDACVAPDDDDDPVGHFLVDPQPTPEDLASDSDRITMRKFLAAPDIELTAIERVILHERIAAEDDELTLEQIGTRFSLSRERIRQLQDGLIRKLRKRFRRDLD